MVDDTTIRRRNWEDSQPRNYPTREEPSDEDPSEEDPSEGEPSGTRPAERDSPVDDMEDVDALPSKYQPISRPKDDDSAGPRVRRLFAVRSWPPGCGRGPHAGPVDDALSREG